MLEVLFLIGALEQPMMPPDSSPDAKAAATAAQVESFTSGVRATLALPEVGTLLERGLDPSAVELIEGARFGADRLIGVRKTIELRVPGGAASCVHMHFFRVTPSVLQPVGAVAIDYEATYRASFGSSDSPQSGALDHERIETTLIANPASGSADLLRVVRAQRHWQTFRLGKRNYASPLAPLKAVEPAIWHWDVTANQAVALPALAPDCE